MDASSRDASLSNAARPEPYPAVSLACDRTRDGFNGDATLLSNGCLFTLARVTALLHSLVSESVVCPLEFPPEVSSFSLSD